MGKDHDDLVETYERIEDAARDEVLLCGGCISHHHGVGKIRKRFMERTLTPMAIEWQKKIKEDVDPTNIFGVNNTVIRSDEEAKIVFKNPIREPIK
jgi:alkyldihydroxyacetonephosphate synthase